jgi:hypothetical protein
MKMNWGTGIFITIVIFLIGMISLVIISSMQPLNLVTPDYYPKAIDYQKQIDRIERTKALDDQMVITQNAENLVIAFPLIDSLSMPEGKILLFFPRDNHLDKEYNIAPDSNLTQLVSKEHLMKGRCVIKISWIQNEMEYYIEEDIMLN